MRSKRSSNDLNVQPAHWRQLAFLTPLSAELERRCGLLGSTSRRFATLGELTSLSDAMTSRAFKPLLKLLDLFIDNRLGSIYSSMDPTEVSVPHFMSRSRTRWCVPRLRDAILMSSMPY